jgi:hypothetical protein
MPPDGGMAGTRTPGWYPDPADPASVRWWNGSTFTDEPFPEAPAEPSPPAETSGTGASAADTPTLVRDRSALVTTYIVGALIPVVGWAAAIYIGVAEKYAAIRRHAIGIGAVSLLTFGIYLVLLLGGSGQPSDSAVASALSSLLANQANVIAFPSDIRCAHQTGNQYVCIVNEIGGNSLTLSVTDDGHSISEVPYP